MTPEVNNELYRRLGHAWWDDDVGEFSTIRFFVNPVRFGFFTRVLDQQRPGRVPLRTVLDVGCGGGILAEEFARAGFQVAGVDPAPESIETARAHAKATGLDITYQTASGENLPFDTSSFDIVACCDVLEHVNDLERVMSEIARVTRPDGLFFYDTINRTRRSRMAIIKVMQDWKATAFAEPNSHVWEKFITPREMEQILYRHGFMPRGMKGISTRRNPVAIWLAFRRRVQGVITFRELGERLQFHESDDLSVSYMGYASRMAPALPSSA
jgi:2-polyprenyl-6-hydroxyphenyl methylase/3-demethylubiquinone-9 3-methyltransferase